MSPPSALSVDLNADLGEGCPWDDLLLDRVSSAGLSCGFHAGEPHQIAATLRAARERGVIVGAHPGFPDRESFGRRTRPCSRDEAEALVIEQVAALDRLARDEGVPLLFLKPHGALYNQARTDRGIAEGIVAAALALGLPVLGQPGGAVEEAAGASGVRFVPEGFADRGYSPDGGLLPRDRPGAILDDPETIASQVLRLVDRGFATLCVHGDHETSVALADLARRTLQARGVAIRGFVACPSS